MRIVSLLLAAGAMVAVGAAQAQQPRAPAQGTVVTGDLARRDVRVPQGEPSLSGSWFIVVSSRNISPLDGGATPFLPWAREFFETRGEAERNGAPTSDPNAACLPPGLPRFLAVPFAFEIVQTPDKIIFAGEVMHTFRVIHMDGKPMPAGFKPSYFGYSAGRWVGDTLVVETTGLNGLTTVDAEWRPKSNRMKVTEEIRKIAPNLIEDTFTIDDPVTYRRPWTSRSLFRWTPEVRMQEYVGEENNRNNPDSTGRLRGQ